MQLQLFGESLAGKRLMVRSFVRSLARQGMVTFVWLACVAAGPDVG